MKDVIYIKGMVCIRCVMAVQTILSNLGIPYKQIKMGRVELENPLAAPRYAALDTALRVVALELMGEPRLILVERVKTTIIELLHDEQADSRIKLSEYLSRTLHYDYTYLSNHFSEVEGSTIERFYLVQRVERVKELIVYENLNVTEISYRMQYSSVSHLCGQFRKITGITPAVFKRMSAQSDFNWREVETIPSTHPKFLRDDR